MLILTFLLVHFSVSFLHSLPTENPRSAKGNSGNVNTFNIRALANLPQKVDWRNVGAVTAVKNQKTCGACWAFSTIETMESMLRLKYGKLRELSVQQVIDCAEGENNGCDGGDTCSVLRWMNSTRFQLTSENDYPLTDVLAKCQKPESSTRVRLETNFTCNNYVGREETMIELLATHGPLVAAVDATTWQDYLGGIIQYHCGGIANHAVQIVGYDLTGEVPYYIVRNSWGPGFGLDGYLRIAIGKNLCEIAARVSTLSVQQ